MAEELDLGQSGSRDHSTTILYMMLASELFPIDHSFAIFRYVSGDLCVYIHKLFHQSILVRISVNTEICGIKNESPLLSLYPNSNSTLRRKFVVCSFRLFSMHLLVKKDMHIYLSFKKLFSKMILYYILFHESSLFT